MATLQVLRFMLLANTHVLSWKWVSTTGHSPSPLLAICSWRNLSFVLRQGAEVSVVEVFEVLNRNAFGQNNPGAVDFDSRWRVFDDMPLNAAKAKARRALENNINIETMNEGVHASFRPCIGLLSRHRGPEPGHTPVQGMWMPLTSTRRRATTTTDLNLTAWGRWCPEWAP